MKQTTNAAKGRDTKPAKPTREKRLSPDGKWQSFPKVPNLVQYVSTGTYFGKVKIGGKPFRESLGTNVFTTAKLLLGDWIKKKRKRAAQPITGTFGEARALYEADTEADHTLMEGSRSIGRGHETTGTLFNEYEKIHRDIPKLLDGVESDFKKVLGLKK